MQLRALLPLWSIVDSSHRPFSAILLLRRPPPNTLFAFLVLSHFRIYDGSLPTPIRALPPQSRAPRRAATIYLLVLVGAPKYARNSALHGMCRMHEAREHHTHSHVYTLMRTHSNLYTYTISRRAFSPPCSQRTRHVCCRHLHVSAGNWLAHGGCPGQVSLIQRDAVVLQQLGFGGRTACPAVSGGVPRGADPLRHGLWFASLIGTPIIIDPRRGL